jgi:hypothetical protein
MGGEVRRPALRKSCANQRKGRPARRVVYNFEKVAADAEPRPSRTANVTSFNTLLIADVRRSTRYHDLRVADFTLASTDVKGAFASWSERLSMFVARRARTAGLH